MNLYRTQVTMQLIGPADDLDALTDRLVGELMDLDGVGDPDLVATLSTGDVEVMLTTSGEDDFDALSQAICDLRTALHAAGIGTPGWEAHIQQAQPLRRVDDDPDEDRELLQA